MFTYTITSNSQNPTGDLNVTVIYSNGDVNVTESYPAEANASTIVATINSRLAQLQAAEDFVTNNPVNQPVSTPISIITSTPEPALSKSAN